MRRVTAFQYPHELIWDARSARGRKEVRWRITRFGLKSGVIAIRRRAALRRLSRTFEPVTLFAPSGKWWMSWIARKIFRMEVAMAFFGGEEGDADQS